MKTVISALVALSVLSGYAASAFADKVPQSIWEQRSTAMVAAVI